MTQAIDATKFLIFAKLFMTMTSFHFHQLFEAVFRSDKWYYRHRFWKNKLHNYSIIKIVRQFESTTPLPRYSCSDFNQQVIAIFFTVARPYISYTSYYNPTFQSRDNTTQTPENKRLLRKALLIKYLDGILRMNYCPTLVRANHKK